MSGMFTLAEAVAWIPGGRLAGDGSVAVQRVHTDTRTLQPGDLFVALRGERFDANDFLAEAQARGAVAAIATRPTERRMRSCRPIATPLSCGFRRSAARGTITRVRLGFQGSAITIR